MDIPLENYAGIWLECKIMSLQLPVQLLVPDLRHIDRVVFDHGKFHMWSKSSVIYSKAYGTTALMDTIHLHHVEKGNT